MCEREKLRTVSGPEEDEQLRFSQHIRGKTEAHNERNKQVIAISALATYCVPVSSIAARQHLRSAVHHQLAVPSHRLSTYGRRAFAIAGPTTWNSLPTHLRRVENSTASFGRLLKTHLFSEY